jgi:isopentenyl phosphate kinase
MTTVVKLGGSVITEKDVTETVDEDALATVAGAVADGGVEDLVLVHGGGSFGHHAAAERDVSSDDPTRDPAAIGAIHAAMTRLSDAVCEALRARDVPAVPVRPLSMAVRGGDAGTTVDATALRQLRAEGFVPVAHGDVVAHRGGGASIASGDELCVALGRALDAERIGMCATTPVRDADGEVVPQISQGDAVAALGGSDSTDVTGGMARKVEALLDADRPGAIFAAEDLRAFLRGEWPGTRVGGA